MATTDRSDARAKFDFVLQSLEKLKQVADGMKAEGLLVTDMELALKAKKVLNRDPRTTVEFIRTELDRSQKIYLGLIVEEPEKRKKKPPYPARVPEGDPVERNKKRFEEALDRMLANNIPLTHAELTREVGLPRDVVDSYLFQNEEFAKNFRE